MYLLAKDTVNGAEGKIVVTNADGENIEVAGMKIFARRQISRRKICLSSVHALSRKS